MTSSETKLQRKIFHHLNTNNDGQLTRDELIKGFETFDDPIDAEELNGIIRMID